MRYKFCFLVNVLIIFCVSTCYAKIVFTSRRGGDTNFQIYVMEDNGSNVRQIEHSEFWDSDPVWFPNGRQILFERDFTNGQAIGQNSKFYILDVNSGKADTFMENHPTDKFPIVSPDGDAIAFNSNRSGIWNIYVQPLKSGRLRQLTDNIRSEWTKSLDWSPDGRQIAYEHEGIEGDNIWVMDSDDGFPKKRLTYTKHPRFFIGAPRWSPSGRYILYTEQERTPDIITAPVAIKLMIIDTITGHIKGHRFPKETLIAMQPSWMKDDRTVLLSLKEDYTDETSTYDIYRYDLDTRKLTNLTNHPLSGDYDPHWIEGSLTVSPQQKLTTRWAKLKKTE